MQKHHVSMAVLGAITFLACKTTTAQTNYAYRTFQDTRVVNGHSTELNDEGELKFIISHRFGRVNGGLYELFGLDVSTIRFGFDYGISKRLDIGIGRSSLQKTYDGFVKYKLAYQKSGEKNFPVSIVYFAGAAMQTQRWPNPNRENYFSSRLYYAHQLLVSRKFNERFSLQLMPTLVHRNLVLTANEANDVLAIGAAPRIKVSKNFTITAEYYYVLPNQLGGEFRNSLALGFNIDTKRHVFQIQIGNSRGMTERFFVTETRGNWLQGQVHLGFNITRDFTIKGKSYHHD